MRLRRPRSGLGRTDTRRISHLASRISSPSPPATAPIQIRFPADPSRPLAHTAASGVVGVISMDEEQAEVRCSVVYFCAHADQVQLAQLYHSDTVPPALDGASAGDDAVLDRIHGNVRALLDEDQGGFDEGKHAIAYPTDRTTLTVCMVVFVASQAHACLSRVEDCANAAPTVVLIELHSDARHDSPSDASETGIESLSFLRDLSADIQGARFQKDVMPFVLVVSEPPVPDEPLHAAVAASCLSAGALDIVHSPFGHEDINRLVGHVKDTTRPAARLVGASMAQSLVDSITNNTPPKIASHRPDQTLTPGRRKTVEDAVGKWHFPAQDFGMDELTYAAMYMLEHLLRMPELHGYQLSRPELVTFLLATRRQYKHQREVHYHNWRHAVDVMQSLYCFLLDIKLFPSLPNEQRPSKTLNAVERLLTPLTGLVMLVSALGHDVGHPGVNNAFLVACNHPLAQMYNDKSVLENYHCAAYSQLLRRHWPSLGTIPSFRCTMTSTVLATDMQRHFEYMSHLSELKKRVENGDVDLEDWSEKEREQTRELLMALLMKAADISNVARPFDISSQWARVLMDEFARQGELESELGIPTCLFGGPPNKEDMLAAAQSQKGFMSLFGFPLFKGMVEIMPSVSCAIRELENNVEIWERKIAYEKGRRNAEGESAPPLTFQSVSKKVVDEAKHRKSEPAVLPTMTSIVTGLPMRKTMSGESESGPPHHSAFEHRSQTISTDGLRWGANLMPSPTLPLSSYGGSSRRSSKDVALDQMQHHLNLHAYPLAGPESRRGSGDAGWQIHQSYPNSRRGSKDESLTTILVTSQGSPGRRASPSSPGRGLPRATGSPSKSSASKRQSLPHSQKQSVGRNSIPSSRSHTTSNATATTAQFSPSTQPSSLAPTDDEATPPAPQQNVAATEDPFLVPGNWPDGMDGTPRASAQDAMLVGVSTPQSATTPRLDARARSGDSDVTSGQPSPRKEGHTIKESRSRSRLRGLKFWRRKRDLSGTDGGPGDNGSP